jgi:hypothetical protein
MVLFVVVVGIFLLSIAVGSGLARLVFLWMERGLIASRRTTSPPPTH